MEVKNSVHHVRLRRPFFIPAGKKTRYSLMQVTMIYGTLGAKRCQQ